MSECVSWVLEVAVKPGEHEAFTAVMEEMVASTEEEPGALVYEWWRGDGDAVHIYERYADSDAVLAHLATFGARFASRFLGVVEPKRLSVYGSPSDAVREALTPMGAVFMGPIGGFAR